MSKKNKKKDIPLPVVAQDVTLIDTHCHLDMADYSEAGEQIITRAAEAGVTQVITIGIDVQSSRRAVEIAERHDVTLGIEPEVSNVVDSAAKARRLLDAIGSPRVRIVMDGANLFHAGQLARMHEILDEAFDLLGPDIALGHAKDLDRDGEAGQVAAGKGLLDYDHYLALFHKVGFRGPLILHSLEEADVPGSVSMLQGKLARLPAR